MSADGKWTTTMNTPMGAQQGSMELSTDGGNLTGTLTAATGDAVEITDGTIDGDNLTWKAAITQPMPITLEFTATVEGDSTFMKRIFLKRIFEERIFEERT